MLTHAALVLSLLFTVKRGADAVRGPNGTIVPPLTVCMSDWRPMVACDGIDSPDAYTGYQVELFRQVASNMGIAGGSYVMTCMDWDAMIADLVDPNGSCDFSAAGVEVSVANLEMGIRFSVPTYKTGLSIMVAARVITGGTFAFMNAFSRDVWIAVGATGIIISMLLWFLERLNKLLDPEMREEDHTRFDQMMWRNLGSLVAHEEYYVSSLTRIVEFAYAFLIVVMVSLYTANTTVQVTTTRFQGNIQGLSDLPGKVVGTWTNYVDIVKKYNIDPVPLPWDNDADQQALFEALRTRKIQALILDSPVLEFTQSVMCDLHVAGSEFNTFSLAIAFPPNTSNAAILPWSFSLVDLQQNANAMDDLQNKFIENPNSPCNQNMATDTSPLQFQQVAGLWIILGISVGIAIVYQILSVAWKKFNERCMVTEQMSSRVSSLLPETIIRAHSELMTAGRSTSLQQKMQHAGDMAMAVAKLRAGHNKVHPTQPGNSVHPSEYNDGKPQAFTAHLANKVKFSESGDSDASWLIDTDAAERPGRLLAIRDLSERLLAAVNAELRTRDPSSPNSRDGKDKKAAPAAEQPALPSKKPMGWARLKTEDMIDPSGKPDAEF